MARIRAVEIKNFRGIKELDWHPSSGINCLIGPGDSGKSTVLDAIDLCIGARRTVQFFDSDFYLLDVEKIITLTVTLGDLDDKLKNFDLYGMFLRGYNAKSCTFEDEPGKNVETVLTVRLTVMNDLEPVWSLVSERAESQGLVRNLSWTDRNRIAPTRLGVMADYHLGWRRGSVLNRVSEERVDSAATLAKITRDARGAFGNQAQGQLEETLGIVSATAMELGIPIGTDIKAMLDTNSISFSSGIVALHDTDGVPLRGLGTGSLRLLIAGIQRKSALHSSIAIIDEVEHGLEPHRIIRLLNSLGSKETAKPLQVFMTTHSPVVLRELSGDQLCVTRGNADRHVVSFVGTSNEFQSTIRLYPDAFLASKVIVCEGASEVGFIRGIDLHRMDSGHESVTSLGTALVDSGGGEAERPFKRANAFLSLGYKVAILRDDDKKPDIAVEKNFIAKGGRVFTWRSGRALEDELFLSLTPTGVKLLVNKAVELHGDDMINAHIKSVSKDKFNLEKVYAAIDSEMLTNDVRTAIGKAARSRNSGWFKSITWIEEIARAIAGPDLMSADPEFKLLIEQIFEWVKANG